MSEVEKEQAARRALVETYGASPPNIPPFLFPKIPPAGYALIVNMDHRTLDKNQRVVYLGICPNVGWVMTRVEPDSFQS